uniref:Uncharacterized protein n=1 Tax=Glossina pallidipes TaxID=7398 RepID=A0A1A9ZRZ1_GLOPL
MFCTSYDTAGVQGAKNSFTSNILESELINNLDSLLTSYEKQFLNGNKAPKTVVPAVALTKNGTCPLALRSNIRRSSSLVIMRPRSSDGTITQLSVPRPHTAAHDFTE